MALEAVATDAVDIVAFGRPFIRYRELLARHRRNLPLAALKPETLTGEGAAGDADYPALKPEFAKAGHVAPMDY